MIKHYLLFAVLLLSMQVMSQTGIGTTTPNASAKLDVFSDSKGFLPPRVALTSTSSFSPITGLSDASSLLTAAGLLVYNTATAGTAPNNVTPGFYYWNGTSWIRLIVPTDNASNVTGTVAVANGGTGTVTGSISGTGALTFTAGGTNQNINLTPSGSGNVVANSKVGIGTNSPGATLEIGSSNGSVPGSLLLNPTTTGTGVEGAEINLRPAPNPTSPAAQTWVIDQVSNANNPRLRIFPSPSGEVTGFAVLDNGKFGIGTTTPTEKLEVSGNVKATNFIGTASSATLYLLEAYANVSYTLPGSYTSDPCRYSIVNNTVNVPSSWFNTSNYAFTPQKAGYWEITASYDVYRNNEANLYIQKNGTNLASAGAIYSVVQQVNKIIYLNGLTDYITIVNVGAGTNPRGQGIATSWFQARWVGE